MKTMKHKCFVLLASFLFACLGSVFAQQKISILGDSYSTFHGYVQPAGNLCWYGVPGEKKENDVTKVEQTWWYCLVDSVSYVLERNNAYSGSTICNTGYEKADYSDRSFITRMTDLGKPDIILVFGGTNDSWAGVPIGDFKYADWTEGELYVGCAGGLDANITFGYSEVATPADGYAAARISVKGLKGGHSGIQIVCQRANANKLLFRLLNAAPCGLLLASVDGGGLRNAIPREAEATVLVPAADFGKLSEAVAAYEKTVQAEFAGIEEGISIRVEACDKPSGMLPRETATSLIRAVVACPDGVVRMSTAMPGLVQTSTNLARVVSDGHRVRLQCLLRSSVASEKQALGEAIAAVFALAGAETELTGAYDGWNPDMSSPILAAMKASYERRFGCAPAITAIHAGLECGIIGSHYPGLDMISFGPTICYPHSPDEKVEIASVGKFYEFLVDTLANAPKK